MGRSVRIFVLRRAPSTPPPPTPPPAPTPTPPPGPPWGIFVGWIFLVGGRVPMAASISSRRRRDLDYYHAKGLNWFRVPILWEHLQPTLDGPLDPTYLNMMDTLVQAAAQRGQHNSFTFIDQGQRPVTGGAQLGSSTRCRQVRLRTCGHAWRCTIAVIPRSTPKIF